MSCSISGCIKGAGQLRDGGKIPRSVLHFCTQKSLRIRLDRTQILGNFSEAPLKNSSPFRSCSRNLLNSRRSHRRQPVKFAFLALRICFTKEGYFITGAAGGGQLTDKVRVPVRQLDERSTVERSSVVLSLPLAAASNKKIDTTATEHMIDIASDIKGPFIAANQVESLRLILRSIVRRAKLPEIVEVTEGDCERQRGPQLLREKNDRGGHNFEGEKRQWHSSFPSPKPLSLFSLSGPLFLLALRAHPSLFSPEPSLAVRYAN